MSGESTSRLCDAQAKQMLTEITKNAMRNAYEHQEIPRSGTPSYESGLSASRIIPLTHPQILELELAKYVTKDPSDCTQQELNAAWENYRRDLRSLIETKAPEGSNAYVLYDSKDGEKVEDEKMLSDRVVRRYFSVQYLRIQE